MQKTVTRIKSILITKIIEPSNMVVCSVHTEARVKKTNKKSHMYIMALFYSRKEF